MKKTEYVLLHLVVYNKTLVFKFSNIVVFLKKTIDILFYTSS